MEVDEELDGEKDGEDGVSKVDELADGRAPSSTCSVSCASTTEMMQLKKMRMVELIWDGVDSKMTWAAF